MFPVPTSASRSGAGCQRHQPTALPVKGNFAEKIARERSEDGCCERANEVARRGVRNDQQLVDVQKTASGASEWRTLIEKRKSCFANRPVAGLRWEEMGQTIKETN